MTFRWKYIKGKIKLWREIILSRLGFQNDFAGYNIILDYVMRHGIHKLPGDVAEIGAFMGGGTQKLGDFFEEYRKKVIVVDIFDPSIDHTRNDRGEEMASIYLKILGHRDLISIFKSNIDNLENIIVHQTDSKEMAFNGERLCLSVIDGNHDPWYVKNDFELLWPHIVNGGAIGLHDYGGDLPQVTLAIDRLIEEHHLAIGHIEKIPKSCFIFIRKREGVSGPYG